MMGDDEESNSAQSVWEVFSTHDRVCERLTRDLAAVGGSSECTKGNDEAAQRAS